MKIYLIGDAIAHQCEAPWISEEGVDKIKGTYYHSAYQIKDNKVVCYLNPRCTFELPSMLYLKELAIPIGSNTFFLGAKFYTTDLAALDRAIIIEL